jgi:chorismate mutase
MDQLKDLRQIIDSVDDQILELVSSRAQLVKEIGRIKKEKSLEILDKQREAEIYDRLLNKAKEKDIDPEAVKKIWKALIDLSYKVEGDEDGNS